MKAVWVVLLLCAGCKGEKRDNQHTPPAVVEAPPVKEPTPPKNGIRSPLPENGPHPDYPTAASAGTDKIFFLEEPDRGPPAPKTYAVPRANLAWTQAAYCSVGAVDLVCSKGPAGPNGYRVGRGKGVTVVEALRANRVRETTVYTTKPDGSPAMRVRIDATGDVVDARLFTQPGRYTARNLDGSNALPGCGMLAYTQDSNKHVTELRCLQWLGDPMRDKTGVAIWKNTLDPNGFVIGEKRFDIDGKPVADITGVHAVEYTLDASGRRVIERRFDVDGVRIVDTTGCAGLRTKYTKDGLVESVTCLAANDGAIPDGEGVTVRAHTYDSDGCETSVRYQRESGGAAFDHDGLQGKDYVPGKYCYSKSETCIGERGLPAACAVDEPAKLVYQRDAKGRITSTKHYDPAGKATGEEAYNVFELRSAYDARGNETDTSCFDESGAPVPCGDTGFHRYHQTYDDAGREILETFFDTEGKPAKNMGIAQRKYRYDNYDHNFEILSLDEDGQPYEAAGAAIQRNLWDSTHRLFAVQLLDAKGRPARYAACYTATTCPQGPWHAVRIYRRRNGRVESNQFFDADGQLMESVDCRDHTCFDTF